MTTADEQAAKVRAGHAEEAVSAPELSLAEWRALAADWKPRMSIWVQVGQLRALIERCERAEAGPVV